MLAWQTAPTVDFTLVLTVRDMPEYQALVQRLFTATNNVRNVRAWFADAAGEVFHGVAAAGDRSSRSNFWLKSPFLKG